MEANGHITDEAMWDVLTELGMEKQAHSLRDQHDEVTVTSHISRRRAVIFSNPGFMAQLQQQRAAKEGAIAAAAYAKAAVATSKQQRLAKQAAAAAKRAEMALLKVCSSCCRSFALCFLTRARLCWSTCRNKRLPLRPLPRLSEAAWRLRRRAARSARRAHGNAPTTIAPPRPTPPKRNRGWRAQIATSTCGSARVASARRRWRRTRRCAAKRVRRDEKHEYIRIHIQKQPPPRPIAMKKRIRMRISSRGSRENYASRQPRCWGEQ